MHYIGKILLLLYKNKRKIITFLGYALFLGFFSIGVLFIYYSKDLPSPETISSFFIPESTKIYDRTGTVILYDIYGEQKRTIIAYEQIPEYVKHATIVAEDKNFYHHFGLDFKAIARAFLTNLKGGEIKQGGSTITQQFIKNAFLTPQRTFPRKIKEAILSFELEWKYSKNEILSLYLNQVPYGFNAYGIESAAQTYFGKKAKTLTLAESAALAVLPQAPTYYSSNTDALLSRQKNILKKMLEFGYIEKKDYTDALAEEVKFKTIHIAIKAPHFVIEVKKYLENKYGSSFVEQAGLRVITTLDATMQEIAEQAINDYSVYNAKNFNAHNASLIAIDPHTGQVLAMVGSKNYFGTSSPEGCIVGKNCKFDPQVNIAITPQQPGSSFKPFVYAEAFNKGYTPNTIVYDVPTEFNVNCPANASTEKDKNGFPCYNPDNYDGLYFGAINLGEAIGQSRNIPSVKVLYLAGIADTINLAKNMGISSLQDPHRYGLSLVLGGGDVTLLEETSAYGVFAARGERNSPTLILSIKDKEGNVLEKFKSRPKKVLDKNIADQINYVLSNNDLRKKVFGETNSLIIGGLSLAAKTGTTQDYRDAWTVGYTPSLSVGVWSGNNNNAKMINAPGSLVSAPIWNQFIKNVYQQKNRESEKLKTSEFYFFLPKISDEESFVVPKIKKTKKNILDGIIQIPHSILYYIVKNNPLGSAPINPYTDPQFKNWESGITLWAQKNNIKLSNKNTVTKTSNITIEFISPQLNSFSREDNLLLSLKINSNIALKEVSVMFNDSLFWYKKFDANTFYIEISNTLSLKNIEVKKIHKIIVETKDNYGNTKKESFAFTVN